ncbi:hypothetical protein C2G38_2216509 [Gigaspora rosea]|uniref:Zn(2)-C6 fungal-type domain-containing protein n=1 Tax=Gigaspora rosea TaxID=44941 RepID=A0A397UC84_9GLOM|nr:hypothetical protein C2G38_2216509 [Gigaspora rosea]
MNYSFNSEFSFPTFTPNEESTVNEINDPYNSSNFLPVDLHPQIQIHEAETPVLSENQNFIKEEHLIRQNFLTPYPNYPSIEVDRGYSSDTQIPSFDSTMSDYDYGYHSDSQALNNNGHFFNSRSTSTFPSVVSASYDDNIFFTNQYNDGYISDSYDYWSDSSCPSPQPMLGQHPNGLYIDTTFGQSTLDPRQALSRKPKKNVTAACSNCKNSHAKCDFQRPCRRCKEKCMTCGSTQNRRRGRKPRSAPSTPEPTSPISPSS